MLKTVTVSASKTYNILIGEGILDCADTAIRASAGGQSAMIVTDDNVAALYETRLSNILKKNGYRAVRFVIPHGESSKNESNFIAILNSLAEEKFTREDVVIALGGGVVGDLAGFAAACYMRGIHFVQIPTTLLAAVDSSVGGKTAINLNAGKNLAGMFFQPDLVICDISLLSTMPAEVYIDGCSEVIKYGVISDPALLRSLETPVNKQFLDIITQCVLIKRDIVAEDEFEKGARKLLNFGHTVGHAIELLSGYQISHGQAVAIGMAVESRAAYRMGFCQKECTDDILRMLRLYNLPENTGFDSEKLAQACLADKKRGGGNLTMIFPTEIGKCIMKEIPICEMEGLISCGLSERV